MDSAGTIWAQQIAPPVSAIWPIFGSFAGYVGGYTRLLVNTLSAPEYEGDGETKEEQP
jgi:hypothetical protein